MVMKRNIIKSTVLAAFALVVLFGAPQSADALGFSIGFGGSSYSATGYNTPYYGGTYTNPYASTGYNQYNNYGNNNNYYNSPINCFTAGYPCNGSYGSQNQNTGYGCGNYCYPQQQQQTYGCGYNPCMQNNGYRNGYNAVSPTYNGTGYVNSYYPTQTTGYSTGSNPNSYYGCRC